LWVVKGLSPKAGWLARAFVAGWLDAIPARLPSGKKQ
jgi:hypothetical protein